MKTRITFIILFALLFSCKENTTIVEEAVEVAIVEKPSLEGAWEMIGLYNYKNNEVVDSFKTREGNRQIKMYTKSRVMWSKLVPADSTEYFAYGAYSLNDSILKETLDYGSTTMNLVIGERRDYIFKIVLEQDKFSQIEIDEDGDKIYSENYKRVD
jgi:ethanolamine utilization protein EutQ (cupin superfamily)